MKKIVYGVLTGSLCMLLLSGCSQNDSGNTSVTLNEVAHSIFYAPQYVAIEEGYFEEEGIDLTLVNGGGADKVMTAMVSGSVANIILDYVFIYPLQMGIFGAVLATGIAPIISMLILSVHKLTKRNHFRLTKLIVYPKHIIETIIIGVPSLINEVSAGLVMIVFNILILNISGNIGIAAYGIIANIALVTTAIYTGIAQGVQPLISDAYGKGNTNAIGTYKKYAVLTIAAVSILLYTGIFLYHHEITAIFNSEQNQQLQIIAETGLQLYFTSLPFVGINILFSTFFTSVNIPLPAHIISMLRGLIIVVPLAYVLSVLFNLTGIWLTVTATEAITMLIGLILTFKHKKGSV